MYDKEQGYHKPSKLDQITSEGYLPQQTIRNCNNHTHDTDKGRKESYIVCNSSDRIRQFNPSWLTATNSVRCMSLQSLLLNTSPNILSRTNESRGLKDATSKKKKTSAKSKVLCTCKSLDDNISLSILKIASENSTKRHQWHQNKDSLGGLILSAKDLSYNGLELSDPVVRMQRQFHAYVPPDTHIDRYV